MQKMWNSFKNDLNILMGCNSIKGIGSNPTWRARFLKVSDIVDSSVFSTCQAFFIFLLNFF